MEIDEVAMLLAPFDEEALDRVEALACPEDTLSDAQHVDERADPRRFDQLLGSLAVADGGVGLARERTCESSHHFFEAGRALECHQGHSCTS